MSLAKQAVDAGAALLLAAGAGAGWPATADAPSQALAGDRAGVVYEVTRDVESAEKGSGTRSTSRSTDRDTLLERVLAVGSNGLELEYDLPERTSPQDRMRSWQFPLRVFKPFSGPPLLLNQPELEKRVAAWLKTGGLDQAACGHWVFTWNAFKIECDPQSALAVATAYDLRPNDLRDGSVYNDAEASGPITLRTAAGGIGAVTFSGSAPADPEHVRREQAESDLVVAEISKQALELPDAIRARSGEQISGTISISFQVDPPGFVRQRTRTAVVETVQSNGVVEHRTVTEVLTRRVVSGEESPR